MKKFITASRVSVLGGAALCFLLFSFTPWPGAHSFQVYLDSKLIIDQYAKPNAEAPRVLVNASEKHDNMIVKYSECGRTVTGRKLTIKDNQDKILKELRFEGSAAGFKESMNVPVKDILALKKGNDNLKVYYSSNDFTQGQQVANIVFSGDAKAALNK